MKTIVTLRNVGIREKLMLNMMMTGWLVSDVLIHVTAVEAETLEEKISQRTNIQYHQLQLQLINADVVIERFQKIVLRKLHAKLQLKERKSKIETR